MRPIDFCFPTLYVRVPVLACSWFIVPTAVPRNGVYVTGCAHYDQGIERFTTFEALRGSPEFIGALSASRTRIWRFSWPFAATFPLTPLSPPYFAPCIYRFLGGARCGVGPPDRFHFGAVTLTEDFAIRGAFPRRVIHVSYDPLQIEAVNHRQSRDFAHRASDYRLLFTPGIPHNACGVERLPLVRATCAASCVCSREDYPPWARPPFARVPL